MLDERKIRLMTRMSVYEKGRGVRDRRTANYFRNDYVFAGLIGSFAAGTLAWGICAAVYCGYYFEQIFFSVYENSLGPFIQLAVKTYVGFILFFLLVSFLIYGKRMIAFSNRRRMYEQDLDELRRIY